MRFEVLAILGLLMAACDVPPAALQAPPSAADIVADAPQGPLAPSPYPVHVGLDLAIDPALDRFDGTATMTLRSDTAMAGFYLHGQGLEVGGVLVEAEGEPGPLEASWQEVLGSGVAWIGFPKPLGPGEMTVKVRYSAPFDANLAGLFKVSQRGDNFALAKSESIEARRFMPGFDQPAFKTPFDVTLTIPAGFVAIANGPEIARVRLDSGRDRVRFQTTRPLPTYLVSLTVGPFDVVEAPDLPTNGVRSVAVPLRGVARRGKGADMAFALETTPALMAIFESAFQSAYPYAKLDLVAAPQWPSSATELAGAITYRESLILAGPELGPAGRRRLLVLHTHELAHSWFGNLVTPPWWDDLWLKEAFSSWSEGFVLSQYAPGAGFELDAIASGLSAMSLDSLDTARAVREPISLDADIRNAYDAITYDKGQAVIGMVDSYFGSEVFRPALGRYVAAFADGVADSRQFFEIIGSETGEPELAAAFAGYVGQNGVPLIVASVGRGSDGVIAPIFFQSRYKPLGSPITAERSWTTPFCFKYGIDGEVFRQCQMLRAGGGTGITAEPLARAPDWILPNAGGTGYWRFSLSEVLWRALHGAFDGLEAGEQMVTLDSAQAEFAAGRMDAERLWSFVEAGARSPSRHVVAGAISIITGLERHVENDPQALTGFRLAISGLFAARLADLQARELSDDEAILRDQIEGLMVRTVRDPELRGQLSDAAAAYIGLGGVTSERNLTSDDFSTALAVGMQDRGADFLAALLAARERIDDPVFAQAVAYAIGENEDPALSEQILDIVLRGQLGARESESIIYGQMRRPVVRRQTWDWVQDNFVAFVEVIPRQRRAATPGLARPMCSAEERAALLALFATHAGLVPGHERVRDQTGERITLCAALEAAEGSDVRAFFSTY